MPKYKDVLDRMEEMYIKIKRHEAEDDHRNLDSEETKQVRGTTRRFTHLSSCGSKTTVLTNVFCVGCPGAALSGAGVPRPPGR